MVGPRRDKRTRPAATLTAFRNLTITDDAKVGASTTDVVDGVVVDLDDRRARRLLRPWPGWWGGRELRSASWAERSRRGAWSA